GHVKPGSEADPGVTITPTAPGTSGHDPSGDPGSDGAPLHVSYLSILLEDGGGPNMGDVRLELTGDVNLVFLDPSGLGGYLGADSPSSNPGDTSLADGHPIPSTAARLVAASTG